jgi:hypothetical protein
MVGWPRAWGGCYRPGAVAVYASALMLPSQPLLSPPGKVTHQPGTKQEHGYSNLPTFLVQYAALDEGPRLVAERLSRPAPLGRLGGVDPRQPHDDRVVPDRCKTVTRPLQKQLHDRCPPPPPERSTVPRASRELTVVGPCAPRKG